MIRVRAESHPCMLRFYSSGNLVCVIGVIVLCCVVIYTSEMMHGYQGVGSRAGIYFVHAVHFKKKSL